MALGEGFEPSWCRINSAVPYQLGDPRMELTAGIAPAFLVYETSVLLLDDASRVHPTPTRLGAMPARGREPLRVDTNKIGGRGRT